MLLLCAIARIISFLPTDGSAATPPKGVGKKKSLVNPQKGGGKNLQISTHIRRNFAFCILHFAFN